MGIGYHCIVGGNKFIIQRLLKVLGKNIHYNSCHIWSVFVLYEKRGDTEDGK